MRSCDSEKAKTEVKNGSTMENLGGGELLTGDNGGDGDGLDSVCERKGKRVERMGNLTTETMGSLYARERERRGRILREMAGALIGNEASVSILRRGEGRGKR